MPNPAQSLLLVAEALVAIGLILGLFRLRGALGRAPLFIAIGTFQYMQAVLAASIYVEVLPGIWVSPGSAGLFMATLAAVLLVYIETDAIETRKLIYGLVAANLTITLLSFSYAHHVGSDSTLNLFDLPREFFFQNLRVMLVGSLVLLIDAVLLILMFEWISKKTQRLYLRLAITLVTIAAFDSVAFVLLALSGREDLLSFLRSAVIGKSAFGLIYATSLWVYVTRIEPISRWTEESMALEVGDVFKLLTYRQKYEAAREQALRDGLTGLYNRRFFEESLGREVERARRDEDRLTLLVLDLDQFKTINDRYGHPVGDRVIQATARVLERRVRASDVACRIGGEEFAVLLPKASIADAQEVAVRVAPEISRECLESVPEVVDKVSATIGLAMFPDDAADGQELIQRADRRLYLGKHAGGARVVVSGR